MAVTLINPYRFGVVLTAPTPVQAKINQGTGNRTVVLDSTPTDGNTLLAFGTYNSNLASDITNLSGWTLVESGNATGGGPSYKCWSKVVAGDSATINMTVAASAASTFAVIEVSGTVGVDQKAEAFNTAITTLSATTPSTTSSQELAVSFIGFSGAHGGLTINNSFVNQGTPTTRQNIATKTIAGGGAGVTSSYNWVNSVNACIVVVTLLPVP